MVEAGDIVQITSEAHHWFGALIVVTEPKGFGCQGFAAVPDGEGNNFDGQAYIRLKTEDFAKVGRSALPLNI